ncbi:hypothetical protein B0H14DRAFT_2650587 [Mycena olivaceomarginata]|nr:hypothetical protein B0H14DRAFT_2650587 [Mycena olivaceomarginata]
MSCSWPDCLRLYDHCYLSLSPTWYAPLSARAISTVAPMAFPPMPSTNSLSRCRDPSQLGLHVPVVTTGCLKYDCHLARLHWEVNFWVGLVVQTLTHCLSARLDLGDTPDWSNGEALKAWLLNVKAQAEGFLHAAGVTTALEVTKSRARRAELAVTFLHIVMRSSQGDCEIKYKRQAGEKMAAGTEVCTTQLDSILTYAQLPDSLDLPPDPNHLAPYNHPILSETFPGWFMGLKDGIEVMRAANVLSRSEAAAKAVQLWTENFVNSNRRTEESIHQTALNRMIDAMRKLINPTSYKVKEILYCACLVHCSHCDWSGLGLNNRLPHDCSVQGKVMITGKIFADVKRVLYVHNILHNCTLLILGDLAPVLADLKLVPVLVDNILWSHQVELKSALCDQDVNVILSAPQCILNVASLGTDSGEPNNTTHTIDGGCTCNNCFVDSKKYKKCAGCQFFEVDTILDLPPHYSWQIWYQL